MSSDWPASAGEHAVALADRVVPVAIEGVVVHPLLMHRDQRGSVCELYRVDWKTSFDPLQWHSLTSRARTIRGMHLHVRHADYKLVVAGRESLVLKDLRRGSATEGNAVRLELSASELTAVIIPPGVAHGIYTYEDAVTLVGSTALYDPGDEFEFSWSDPELGIEWPAAPAYLSPRDQNAQSLRSLIEQLEPFQPL